MKPLHLTDSLFDEFSFGPADIERLRTLVDGAAEIVITCHVSPDGDAMGSSLALCRVLCAMGKKASVVTPDRPTATLSFLPGSRYVVVASQNEPLARRLIDEAKLIFCLDFNAIKRIDRLEQPVAEAACPKVMIDHHLYPEPFAALTFSRPEASSTCYMLYCLLRACGWHGLIDRKVAECLYTGMMTDTGCFQYSSDTPGLYLAVADLAAHGVGLNAIYKRVFQSMSLDTMRLIDHAMATMEVFVPEKAALLTLSKEELADYHYQKGDTEGLVNKPLVAREINYSIYLREDRSDFVKVSARSKGNVPVNVFCERYFGGGGHLNAAGGEFHGSLAECRQKVMQAIKEFGDGTSPADADEPLPNP